MLRKTLCACLLPALLPAQEPRASVREDAGFRELRLHGLRAHVDAILDARDGAGVLAPEDRRGAARAVAEQLRDAIRAFVEPRLEGEEQIEAFGHEQLAVLGRPAQHAWIESFLALQAKRADSAASIDVEVLKVTPAVFEDLDVGDGTQVLDAAEAAELRRKLLGPDGAPRAGIERVVAPRLGLRTMQRAEACALEQVAYIRDFDLERLADGTLVADPQVDTVEAGTKLSGWFVAVSDRAVGLSWHVRIQDLQRPIPEFETRLGTKGTLKIQLPEVRIAEVRADVVVADGALAVVPGPAIRGDRVVLLLAVGGLR